MNRGSALRPSRNFSATPPCWNIADCPFEKRKQYTAFLAIGPFHRENGRIAAPGDGMAA